MDKANYTVAEAAAYLTISRSQLYKLIAEKRIKPFKIGSRVVIPLAELKRFVVAARGMRS